ncbi:hypothetical protein PVAG01_06940 [Phlyctema vagabunda]|uniref:Uncharacterized protein n=1 Tax=Phlyctema vagabunda TaxID=108571 RepID=A0ABR4PB19_9HELO
MAPKQSPTASASATHTRPRPRPPSPSTTGSVQAETQIPDSPEWYYNDDYNDPVNFGFMFPIPKGGQKKTHQSVDIDQSTGSEGGKPPKKRISPTIIPKQIPEAAKFVSSSITNNHVQSQVIAQPSLASLNAARRNTRIHNIPYRYSPSQTPHSHLAHKTPNGQTTIINTPTIFYGPLTAQQFESTRASQLYSTEFTPYPADDILSYAQSLDLNENLSDENLQRASAKRKGMRSPSSTFSSPSQDIMISGAPGAPPRFISKRRRPVYAMPQHNLHHVIDPSLCSRCQIYSKGLSDLCDSCIQATNFTAWPSVSGTRRENMESLVLYLLPAHMEDCVRNMSPITPKSRTWRLVKTLPPKEIDFSAVVFPDQFTLAKEEVRSTGLFSEDFADLADIAQTYQRSLPVPNVALEASCKILTACCELYKSIVAVSQSTAAPQVISATILIENIQNSRTLMFQAFRELQSLALSPSVSRSREAWLPSFLCACMMATSAVIFLDILVVCPSPWKEQIWGQGWQNRISEIRHGGYGMLVNLLQANTMNVNPLKIDIWSDQYVSPMYGYTPEHQGFLYNNMPSNAGTNYIQEDSYTGSDSLPDSTRNSVIWGDYNTIKTKAQHERDILLGSSSPAALQGLLSLKAWQQRYDEHLKMGEDMFSKDLYRLAMMKPIAGLWRVFEMK